MNPKEWERLVQRLVRERILKSPKVIQAFSRVPRTRFIPERSQSYATVDTPLPIGFGQTISAPHG